MDSFKVITVGYGPMASGLLKGLLSAQSSTSIPIEIVGVFSWELCLPDPDALALETYIHLDQFLKLARANQVPLMTFPSVNSYSLISTLMEKKVNLVLVGSWGELLRPHLLSLPDTLFVNCHPSLLPLHRGPNPYSAVVKQKEARTGITFHLMDEQFDTGPILLQRSFDLFGDETGGVVRQRCSALAKNSVVDLLQGLHQGTLQPQPQTELGSYDKAPNTFAGWIDWSLSPDEVMRHIRSIQPWIDSYAVLSNGARVAFDSAHLHPIHTEHQKINSPLSRQSKQPGEVLLRQPQDIWVSSCEEGYCFRLHQPQLMDLQPLSNLFPMNLMMMSLYLKPGTVFHCPKKSETPSTVLIAEPV